MMMVMRMVMVMIIIIIIIIVTMMVMMMMMMMLSIVCSHASIIIYTCLSDCLKVVLLLGVPRRDLHQHRYVLGCIGKTAPSTDVHLGDVVSSICCC
jgi:hypothetical protein